MNKSAYQILRWSVDEAISNARHNTAISDVDFANNLMRLFLQRLASEQVNSQKARREFLTFRRNPENIAPSWALHNPGISSRLPTL